MRDSLTPRIFLINMSTIQQIYAREVLDSRGIPTIECSLWLDDGRSVITTVPSGTSTGKYEAIEIRDNDSNRMVGKGVLKAVENINNLIGPQLVGHDPTNQTEADQKMVNLDGTKEKSKLGANAILAVSQAILKAGALSSNLPLYKYIQQKYQLTEGMAIPTCIFSMVEGGKHGAENLDIQEFEIIPASHIDYPNALNMAVTIYHKIKEVLIMKGAIHSTGLNGGFTPNLFNNTDAFEIIIESIKATPYTFAQDVFLGADMSASSFFESGKYNLKDKSQAYTAKDLAKYYKSLKELYHVFYIEDPFQEDDTNSWKELTSDIGSTSMIVGDSLIVTSLEKVGQAIKDKTCNSVLVKPNQTGTVSETIQVIKLAKESGWQVIVSHRSGGTIDDFIADLAVGTGSQYVKFGPPNRGERIAKYNRLSAIYDELQYDSQQVTQQTTQPTSEQQQATQAQAVPEQNQPAEVAPVTEQPAHPTTPEAQEITSVPVETPQPAQQPTQTANDERQQPIELNPTPAGVNPAQTAVPQSTPEQIVQTPQTQPVATETPTASPPTEQPIMPNKNEEEVTAPSTNT